MFYYNVFLVYCDTSGKKSTEKNVHIAWKVHHPKKTIFANLFLRALYLQHPKAKLKKNRRVKAGNALTFRKLLFGM